MIRIILIVVCVLLSQCCLVFGDDTEADLEKAYAKAGTGDIRPILSVLDSIEDVYQSQFAGLYEKYKSRFITVDEQIEFDDSFITSLYHLYTAYWRTSLLDPECEKKARKTLISGLDKLAKSEGREATLLESFTGPKIDKLEAFFIKTAKERGFNLLMGMTLPLRELMIWKKEEKDIYRVELPSDSFSVNVIFAQDFISKGWLGYATFDKRHTGGWFKGDTIYRVGKKPEDNDEWFRVSLLGHEGRHISDVKRYGMLDSWLLEYRAKLTELILAEKSFWNLLNGFKNEAQEDISFPHSYGSYQLIIDLMNELTQGKETKSYRTFRFEDYTKDRLKDAMVLILDKNTKSLEIK